MNEKHLLEELKKLVAEGSGSAQTTGERMLAAILLDIYERENKPLKTDIRHDSPNNQT